MTVAAGVNGEWAHLKEKKFTSIYGSRLAARAKNRNPDGEEVQTSFGLCRAREWLLLKLHREKYLNSLETLIDSKLIAREEEIVRLK